MPRPMVRIEYIRPVAFTKKEKEIGIEIAKNQVLVKAGSAAKALNNLTKDWNHKLHFLEEFEAAKRSHTGAWRRTVLAEVKPLGSPEAVMVFETLDQGLEEGEIEGPLMFFTPTGIPDVGGSSGGERKIKRYETESGYTYIRSIQQRVDPFKPKTKPNSLEPQPTGPRKKPGIATRYVMTPGIKPRNFIRTALKLYRITEADAMRITRQIEAVYASGNWST